MRSPLFLGLSALTAASSALAAVADSYDYIVVGAGTAGATLAARIAEDPSVTVLVIEAGKDTIDQNLLAYIPGADVLGVGWFPNDTTSYDWNFVTVPQKGAANRAMHYARGKGVGGTSNRNFMLFHRPTFDSFDYWVNATQGSPSPGWTWNDVYTYYTKSSTLPPPNLVKRDGKGVGTYQPSDYPEKDITKAPLRTTFPNYVFNYSIYMENAFYELKYPYNNHAFSGGNLVGHSYAISTINPDNDHRATSQLFLDNAKGLTNLQLLSQTLVTKVNFDSSKRAVSVTYKPNVGALKTVKANKEIILSAGAFQTPQLLMLSGIGPAAQLQQFGIPVVVDLPGVGQNMQDHVFFSPAYEIKTNIYNFGHEARLLRLAQQGVGFYFRDGSLVHPVSDYLGWQRLNNSFIASKPELAVLGKYPAYWPHIEYIAAGGLVGDFSNLYTLNAQAAEKNKFYYSMEAVIISPQSRGTVKLASADPTVLPLIDPAFLTSPADQTLAIEMYKKVRRFFNTTAFRASRNNEEEYFPGYNVSSDADILAVIQRSVQTLWHAGCTAAMQPRSNNGVLDPYLRVYGVTGLRVVDASAFPTLLPGHPQATLYMLAERATDFLKIARGAKVTTVRVNPPARDTRLPYSGPN